MKLNKGLKTPRGNGKFSLHLPVDDGCIFYVEASPPLYFISFLPSAQYISTELPDTPIPFVLIQPDLQTLLTSPIPTYVIHLSSNDNTEMKIISCKHLDTLSFVHEHNGEILAAMDVDKSYFL